MKRPIHILTKSTLVERDLDMIQKINEQNRAMVSFSFSSVDDTISAVFEPGVPSPTRRLETIARIKKMGIPCGMYLMPVIPFITDTPEKLGQTFQKARDVGVDFIIFSGMTLKEGRQMDYFYSILKSQFPDWIPQYHAIYRKNTYGQATDEYYHYIHQVFLMLAEQYRIPIRMPPFLFTDMLDENDRVVVMLEHMDYVLRLKGQTSPYAYAAYSISQLKEPLSTMPGSLRSLKGVGKVTENIIREILRTGSSAYYKRLVGL
jgi:hypothetical protein